MTVQQAMSPPACSASATELVAALRRRRLGSRELLDAYLDRVDRLNPPLNAVVTLDAERARAEAAAADEAAARGESLGPLHGLPVTVKDSIETAGLPTVCGAPELAGHVPGRDAVAVARLRAAGAIVFGKTNTPTYAGEAQTWNPVFGTTNNPWDPGRSPGGSSGGPAAAVAASLTGLDLGSDLGGSIRMPAGYCGVYGLRPSYGIVPNRGHVPPAPHGRTDIDMATMGPLARGPADLGLALGVLAGPEPAAATAWRLELPAPRADALSGYRIGVWLDDPSCPVDAEVLEVLEAAVAALRDAGAKLDELPGAIDLAESARLFQRLCQPAMSLGLPDGRFAELCELAASGATTSHARWARDVTARARDHGLAHERRLGVLARWAELFRDHDALLCPITPTVALPHDQSPGERWIKVNGEDRDYWAQVHWTQAISIAHLPVAAVPVGRSRGGLPVGAQLVGPHLEDRTVVDLAGRIAEVLDGFSPPPGY
jgi:amidase